jgi:hypothetical protein
MSWNGFRLTTLKEANISLKATKKNKFALASETKNFLTTTIYLHTFLEILKLFTLSLASVDLMDYLFKRGLR